MCQVHEYLDSTMKLLSLCIPGLHRIMTTHQVHEYPDSTISKISTILKWQTTTTLNRKLLEKQRA